MSEEHHTVDSIASPEDPPKPGRVQRFRRTVMAGISVIAPIGITAWVLWNLFNWGAGLVARPVIKPFATMFGDPDWYNRGVGFLVTVSIIWLVGIITTNVVGRRVLTEARKAIERLPVVRTIYMPVRQLMETFTSAESGSGFQKVVLFEYPRRELWTLGFLAGDVPMQKGGTPAHSIFVPTAPNPTTGFMLIVPRDELRHTTLSIEEAFQMIVSAGVAVPASLKLPPGVAESSDRPIDVQVIDERATPSARQARS